MKSYPRIEQKWPFHTDGRFSEVVASTVGVPQGSIFGPLFFGCVLVMFLNSLWQQAAKELSAVKVEISHLVILIHLHLR